MLLEKRHTDALGHRAVGKLTAEQIDGRGYAKARSRADNYGAENRLVLGQYIRIGPVPR